MMLQITITRTSTGEKRLYCHPHEGPWDDEDGVESYIWGDGNYGCDCNRSLFFGRAIDPAFDDAGTCGNEAYTLSIADEAGVILYAEPS